MNRSRLWNTFLHDKRETSKKNKPSETKKLLDQFFEKDKKVYFKNLNEIGVANHKKFWKTKKPLFW